MTNERVSKIIREQLTLCTFCNNATETICHLFWECPIVGNFIQQINNRVIAEYPLYFSAWNKRSFVFSAKAKNILNPQNVFSLYIKYYIWIQRYYKKVLSVMGFINYFNHELSITKTAFRGNMTIDRLQIIEH